MEQAHGRLLAVDVVAAEPVPNYTKSTMDGYVVRSVDIAGAGQATPIALTLDGSIAMGLSQTAPLLPGTARQIPTGGMVPTGADAVVMIEDTLRQNAQVLIKRNVLPGENVIKEGEDITIGDTVLRKGTRLGASQIGALATLSIHEVTVYRKPRFAILSTGDEVRSQQEPLLPGQVRDSNASVLAAQVPILGGVLTSRTIGKDDKVQLRAAMDQAREVADILLVTGGSSVGEKDYTKTLFASYDDYQLLFHGIAAKPGKPAFAATTSDTLLVGLPGHPASCNQIFQMLFYPVFRDFGLAPPQAAPVQARLARPVRGVPGLRTYQVVVLETNEANEWWAYPLRNHSALVSSLAKASGYFVIEEKATELPAGSTVLVYPLEGA